MTTLSKKDRTHERIVRSAARAIRREGYEGVSVAEVMREAGLTHGGFYAHFPSREALLVEALDCAMSDTLTAIAEGSDEAEGTQWLEGLIERYLSDAHADRPEEGCSLAALGTETPRQSPEVRAVAGRKVREMVKLVEKALPASKTHRREDAMAILSAMVGGLVLSRMIKDRKEAQSFRAAAKRLARSVVG